MKGSILKRHRSGLVACNILFLALAIVGCRGKDEIVVYSALDREFAEPILDEFAERAGVRVLARYDVESTKTVGLVQAIRAESRKARCDLFWNNEILHTIRLQQEGLLDTYLLDGADGLPPEMQSGDGAWYGFAARARVFLVNLGEVPFEQFPQSIGDLVDPKWKGRVGIAKPLFGTTATHMAVLYSEFGPELGEEYLRKLKENCQVLAGNKHVAQAVSSGQLAWGLTDSDDAFGEYEKGEPVAIVFPDQEEGGLGALRIPNTLAIMRNPPNRVLARKLMNFLVSPAVEDRLARSGSAQIPLHPDAHQVSPVMPDEPVLWMDIDFTVAARDWEKSNRLLVEIFRGE